MSHRVQGCRRTLITPRRFIYCTEAGSHTLARFGTWPRGHDRSPISFVEPVCMVSNISNRLVEASHKGRSVRTAKWPFPRLRRTQLRIILPRWCREVLREVKGWLAEDAPAGNWPVHVHLFAHILRTDDLQVSKICARSIGGGRGVQGMDSAKKANQPLKHGFWHVQTGAGQPVRPGGIPIARRRFETRGTGTNVLLSQ
jgi:hypothetical protein